jgi:hypothetical protein
MGDHGLRETPNRSGLPDTSSERNTQERPDTEQVHGEVAGGGLMMCGRVPGQR